MVVLKWVAVMFTLACGIVLLVAGLGATVPLIEWQGVKAYGVPVGIAVMLVGVLLAKFWKVETHTTVHEHVDPRGGITRIIDIVNKWIR